MKLIIHNLTAGGMGETYALSITETREHELEGLDQTGLRKHEWVKDQLKEIGIHPFDAMVFTTSKLLTRTGVYADSKLRLFN